MSTALAIIQSSLEELGVYSPGEVLTSADSTRALDQLNKLLDSWSNESLTTFTILEQKFALVPGKAAYTIGLTGSPDVNQARPIRVLESPGTAYVQDTNQNNFPVKVVAQARWNQIGNRGSATVSNIPDTLFYDPQMPLGIVNIWPTPTLAYTLFLDSYAQLSNLANVNTNISLPPGYEAAIQHNLCIWLAPFFKNGSVSDEIKFLARDTKKVIKRSNMRTNEAAFEIGAMGRSSYNVYTDSTSK